MPPKQAAQPSTSSSKKGYSVVGDGYGMLALNSHFHRGTSQRDADVFTSMVSRGIDVNSVGLTLSQSEPLYPTFSSPWSDVAVKVQPEFRIPQCYLVSPPHLKFALFQKFHLQTLFYIFYSMPRDVLQLAAAQELHNRQWWYHKKLNQWITRAQGSEPTAKTAEYERGTFQLFNPDTWKEETRDDFVLNFCDLEDRDSNPNVMQQGQPQVQPPKA